MTRPLVRLAGALLLLCACSYDLDAPPAGSEGGSAGDDSDGDGAPATAGADAAPDGPPGAIARVTIDPGALDEAELVETLPIGRSADGAPRRVVLHLGPGDLPDLVAGDRLITPAEVQVTTRCDVGQVAPGCGYNPTVAARLILSGAAGDVDPGGAGSRPLGETATQSCTAAEHHCMFVFTPGAAANRLDGDLAALPCLADDSCHVNLVMWAWHPDARAGGADVLLVGGNDGDYLANGEIDQDQARLMVVRERGVADGDRHVRTTSGTGTVTMPLDASEVLIYSHPLKADGAPLRAGEQFLVEATVVTHVSARARFSTHMFVTRDPSDRQPSQLSGIAPGAIGEHNGINCTPGTSPCTTRKVAVFRATEDSSGPVYVNLIARSEVPGGGASTVTVKRAEGSITSTRYDADLR